MSFYYSEIELALKEDNCVKNAVEEFKLLIKLMGLNDRYVIDADYRYDDPNTTLEIFELLKFYESGELSLGWYGSTSEEEYTVVCEKTREIRNAISLFLKNLSNDV